MRCECCNELDVPVPAVGLCRRCFWALAIIKSKHGLRCGLHKRIVSHQRNPA